MQRTPTNCRMLCDSFGEQLLHVRENWKSYRQLNVGVDDQVGSVKSSKVADLWQPHHILTRGPPVSHVIFIILEYNLSRSSMQPVRRERKLFEVVYMKDLKEYLEEFESQLGDGMGNRSGSSPNPERSNYIYVGSSFLPFRAVEPALLKSTSIAPRLPLKTSSSHPFFLPPKTFTSPESLVLLTSQSFVYY